MKSKEKGVLNTSEYFVYSPTIQGKKSFFYVVSIGDFKYDTNYKLKRRNDDSFLIMYIEKGKCELNLKDKDCILYENQIAILDCGEFHLYSSITNWETKWIHFNGPVAREYFDIITKKYGNILNVYDSLTFLKKFNKIYDIFENNMVVKEYLISKYICDLLTDIMAMNEDKKSEKYSNENLVELAITYIREHLTEKLTLEDISSYVNLSPYYFTRLFKKKTALSPHQYIMTMRLDLSKFLLRNTGLSIKEICFETGFNSESMFCYTFKQKIGVSPLNYRNFNNLDK
ncbi:MAG: AraC family transcriptional regulator [Lachnospirales bacterium]